MLTMAVQLAGVAVAVALLYVAASRAGLELAVPAAAAFASVLFLAVVAVGKFDQSWHALDVQREQYSNGTPAMGRDICTQTGADPNVVSWVASHIPTRARFYEPFTPALVHGGGTCLRFLLLPRLEVARLSQAHYVLFWAMSGEPLISELKRRGATVETYAGQFHIARLPGA
jgi:hypothetical protein